MPDISDEDAVFLDSKERARMMGHLHAHRRVLISGGLNKKTLRKTSLELVKLDYQSSEPILIILESDGGDVVATQQFADVISMINSPIDVIGMGDCCSMAVDLIQMCRTRMLLPSARILVHYIRNSQPWIGDDPDRLEIDVKYFMDLLRENREQRFALYEKRTGLSREKLIEIFRHGEIHDACFSAKQALELGLIDEIVTDFKFFPRKSEA